MFTIFKKQTEQKKTAFMPLYDRIANEIKEGKILTPDGNKYSAQTARNYRTGAHHYTAYEQINGIIYLEDINVKWAEQFAVYLMGKGLTKNTVANILIRVKAILRRACGEGLCTYNGSGIKAPNEQVTTVYNTLDELREMLDTDLSDTAGFARVRDVYVLQSFIGLRFADLRAFLQSPKNFLREEAGKLFIEIKTRKTGEVVVIPVSYIVKDILVKYDYRFKNLFSYQYYNPAIKEVARRAGITQNIVFTRTEGGCRVDTNRQKCELMSSHSARRTFATNAFLAGIPEKHIMMITGHLTTTAFHRYIRCSKMDAAITISNHPFFKIHMPVPVTLPVSSCGNESVLLV